METELLNIESVSSETEGGSTEKGRRDYPGRWSVAFPTETVYGLGADA
ncbi:MAG: hypothetical protein ACLVH3_17505 [Blautia obeum]